LGQEGLISKRLGSLAVHPCNAKQRVEGCSSVLFGDAEKVVLRRIVVFSDVWFDVVKGSVVVHKFGFGK
jgi:hypothetical protein